jgi:hypothetical protein
MTRTDPALVAAARMIDRLAEKVDLVRAHVNQELNYADGHNDHTPGASEPTSGPSTPLTGTCATVVPIDADLNVWRTCGRRRPCGEHDAPVALTAVERAADRRLRLNLEYDDFVAQCRLIVVAASDALRTADRIIGTRLELGKITECRDGQDGKDGVMDWGDVLCLKPSVKGNLCQAHYSKWVRWRTKHGKKTPDIEDAA